MHLLFVLFLFAIMGCHRDPGKIAAEEKVDTVIEELESKRAPREKPEFNIEIDRESAQKLGISFAQISTHIGNMMDLHGSLTMETLLDTRIEFRNERGQLISIPLRAVVKNPADK